MRRKTVFFDVDTQLDFVCSAGALSVPGAPEIHRSLGALTALAATRQVTIISTMDAHAEDDPEFRVWKPHCVVGTTGQQKLAVTLTKAIVTMRSTVNEVPDTALLTGTQVIVEKRFLDAFTNPNLVPLLDALSAERYVLYGVVTELCVQCAATGLLKTGARVELVTDAVKSLDAEKEREMVNAFRLRGGVLTSVAEVTRTID